MPYIPKKQWPPKSIWIKSLITAMNWCTLAMTKIITNLKSLTQVPTTRPPLLWPSLLTQETMMCPYYGSNLHDIHMAQWVDSTTSMRQTI